MSDEFVPLEKLLFKNSIVDRETVIEMFSDPSLAWWKCSRIPGILL
jgi:hypothetical protein